MIALLASKTQFLSSNGEARRALKENSISVNKAKVDENYSIGANDLIDGKYVLLQRGKKNYFIVEVMA
jgi:tyrosyl-tRNA synthetase